MYFYLFIGFVIFQRLMELVVARRNEKWSRGQGAVEYGKNHYPYMVMLHTAFIVAMAVEYYYKGGKFSWPFMLIFVLLLSVKVWVIASLGKYWNTKILRVPHAPFIKKGPYKLFKHPNYFIVVCEIVVIPMVFGLYITAIVFTVLNAAMLTVRIKAEEQAWAL
jgi:methyltransferase